MTTHNVNQVYMQHTTTSQNPSTQRGLTQLRLFRGALACLLLAGLLLFAACEEQPYGIFASIEREQAVPDSELGEDATIFGMAQLGDEYWLSYMQVMRRPVNGSPSDWRRASHPSAFSSSGDHAVSLVGEPGGDVIYAAFRNNRASSWNVYKRGTGGGWVSLNTKDHKIIRLFFINDELFGAAVSERNNGAASRYELVHIDTDGATPHATRDTGSYPVRGGAFFGSTYTFFTKNRVYQHENFADLEETSPSGLVSEPRAAVVFNDGDGARLYISGEDGVSVSSDGDSFDKKSGGNTLNGFGEYTSGTVNYLIVGSQDPSVTTRHGDGYYLVAQSDTGTRSSPARVSGERGDARGAQRYEGTLLATAHIRDFFVPSSNDRVFALTVGRGLWSARIRSNGELEWLWE